MNPRDTWSRMETLLGEAVEALEDACIPVGSWGVEPGEPDWAYCCDGGHAYIRLVEVFPSDDFPNQLLTPRACQGTVALVELGVLRCHPVAGMDGSPPSVEEVTESAHQAVNDMSVIHSVLVGHKPVWSNYPVVLQRWVPLGPDGGCSGGAWRFWLDVSVCAPECEVGSS